MRLSVHSTGTAVSVDPAFSDRAIDIAAGERKQVLVPISGARVGDDVISASLTLPDGTILDKSLNIGVRLNEPPVATTDFVTLAPGAELSVSADRDRRARSRDRIGAGLGERRRAAQRAGDPARARSLSVWLHGADHQPRHAARLPERRGDPRRPRRRPGHPRPRRQGDRRCARQPVGLGLVRPVGAGKRGHVARRLCHRLPEPRPAEGLRGAGRGVRPGASEPQEQGRLCERLHQRRRGHRLRALRARRERPGRDRRPPLLRRDEARRLCHAARQGADRRGAGALRRQAARGGGVQGGARRPRPA